MYFQKGRLTLGKLMYRFVERSPQDTRHGFDLYSAQTSFAWPRIDSARRLSAILRVRQSLLDSFLQLGKLHRSLYLMLSYFYDS